MILVSHDPSAPIAVSNSNLNLATEKLSHGAPHHDVAVGSLPTPASMEELELAKVTAGEIR